MALEWYEWECPHCRRIGQVNPARDYEDGETIDTTCPICGGEIVVLCDYEPTFIAYRPENWRGDSE